MVNPARYAFAESVMVCFRNISVHVTHDVNFTANSLIKQILLPSKNAYLSIVEKADTVTTEAYLTLQGVVYDKSEPTVPPVLLNFLAGLK
ncbi:hypothetical protein BpHYR1_024448 [Brachionus plicatilis]|uniref:Uncharacterized protein n=1 Tax=Brachionus plicatilis TaxID=10195 RepID=A0A3M7SAZ0_BRAPC|nr:hypothetical protein BpHYR1_024448 [Brachionus plicatilis]